MLHQFIQWAWTSQDVEVLRSSRSSCEDYTVTLVSDLLESLMCPSENQNNAGFALLFLDSVDKKGFLTSYTEESLEAREDIFWVKASMIEPSEKLYGKVYPKIDGCLLKQPLLQSLD